ncbi:chromosome segregation SMC family protein [Pseudoalteromonas sp. T1lg65]|uniref:chromosome segregation SMC family protein n=1 Tax=Pseudoalteromonas sp. T1lg65 TaxID=2077101 RepID=UPI003F79FF78
MRLSSIKLAGFKSFVEPTKIPFPDQMTCVVGPNGCGKSNVIDAVRWVLGESSAKNLRGDAMTDVIFNGSTKRKAISQASVELIFDNTQGRLPGTFADRTQIAIKRLVTRDGQSLYFLNGSKCRRRDITDIFLGTGLGPRSYAIIEQGMISRLIESKPQELRIFLEEAAGISKYKERRRETQTRIKSTKENLERLLDVRQELQNQLDKLELQAQQAGTYKALKQQERDLKAWIAVLKWQSLQQKQMAKSQAIEKLNEQLAFYNEANSGHSDVLASLEQEIRHFDDGYQQALSGLHKIETQLASTEQQKHHLAEKLRQLNELIEKLTEQVHVVHDELNTQQEMTDASEQRILEVTEALDIAELAVEEINEKIEQQQLCTLESEEVNKRLLSELRELQSQLGQRQQHQAKLQQNSLHVEEKLVSLGNELQTLESHNPAHEKANQQQTHQQLTTTMAGLQRQAQQCEQSLTNLSKQCQQQQSVVDEKRGNVQSNELEIKSLQQSIELPESDNAKAMLSQLVAEKGFEDCVEAALLGLSHLQVGHEGVNVVKDVQLTPTPGSVAEKIQQGVYPTLLCKLQLIEKEEYIPSEEFIAGVTPQGVIVGENFKAILSGDNQVGTLKRLAKLEQCQQMLPGLRKELECSESELKELHLKADNARAELGAVQEQVHAQAQAVTASKTKLEMLESQLASWQHTKNKLIEQKQSLEEELEKVSEDLLVEDEKLLEVEQRLATFIEQQTQSEQQLQHHNRELQSLRVTQQSTQNAAHQAKLKMQQVQSERQLSESKLTSLKLRVEDFESRLRQAQQDVLLCEEPLAEATEEIERLLVQHVEQGERKQQLLDSLEQAKHALVEKQKALKDVEGEASKLTEQLQQLKLEEQSLMIKAQSALEPLQELQRTLKTELESLPEDANLSQYQATLTNVTSDIGRLGAVNLAAIDEFEEAKARKLYLDNQLDDLMAALDTLETVIKKIDKETKTRFSVTFNQVNEDLAELFPKVFGGGSAYLELTSDDLLESGVSIMARPPGKKNSTIHLLSGGEKALTALSLVFSIFRLNPAPFCMLDEVDAPLDDANVGRFCRLVEEMSQTVQFIYISHNKVAMEMAGRLTGVTMAEPGVSRMVAVDIEQAVQMAQA